MAAPSRDLLAPPGKALCEEAQLAITAVRDHDNHRTEKIRGCRRAPPSSSEDWTGQGPSEGLRVRHLCTVRLLRRGSGDPG